jgi:hypothetical protein
MCGGRRETLMKTPDFRRSEAVRLQRAASRRQQTVFGRCSEYITIRKTSEPRPQ